MTKALLFFLALLWGSAASGQDFILQGTLRDTTNKPVTNATVLLMSPKDSSLLAFGRSNSAGDFVVKKLKKQLYYLKITHVGLRAHEQLLPAIEEAEAYDLGKIVMKPWTKELDEVKVTGSRNPIEFKQDTIEYNAGSFKTRPNAVVEDLLKKLPGVEVGRDGTVKAQGQTVSKVLVDGKEFFGNDPKIATKNLPADAVNKVQVFDKKSDMATFSGVDDGQRQKAINLTLKDDKKNGYFGRVAAGYGSDARFNLKGNINSFAPKRQFSTILSGNNVNQQGFSLDEALQMSGGIGGGSMRFDVSNGLLNGIPVNFGEKNNGFMRAWSGGMNYNKELNKNTQFSSNYFLNELQNLTEQTNEQDNFFPNRRFRNESESRRLFNNQNHRFNLILDAKLDSANSIKWIGNIAYNRSQDISNSKSRALSETGRLENDGTRNNTSYADGVNMKSELLWRHKFARVGRSLSVGFNTEWDNRSRNEDLLARNRFYNNGELTQSDSLDQNNRQANQVLALSLNGTYTEPLGKRQYLSFRYNFTQNNNDVNQEVFDQKEGRSTRNTALSNDFDNTFRYHRPGIGFRKVGEKGNFSAGLSFQRSDLDGLVPSRGLRIQRDFGNWLPNLTYEYAFSNTNRLNFLYQTSIREPRLEQLAPLVDNSNPLNVFVGNPDLQPEYNHRFDLNYNAFNLLDFTSFFFFFNVVYTRDKIQNGQDISAKLVRTTRPQNVDTDLSINGNINYGFRLRPIKTKVEVGGRLLYGNSLNPVNGQLNITDRWVMTPSLKMSYEIKDKLSLSVEGLWRYNRTSYSIQSSQNQEFMNQSYWAELDWTVSNKYQVHSLMEYDIFDLGRGQKTQVPIWQLSVSRYVLEGDRGELKLSVFDALNRNVGINRTADANYVSTQQIRSLGRYYMLTFTYSLRKAGLKKSKSGLDLKMR
jgi:Outer membrane protein beta-barrel family